MCRLRERVIAVTPESALRVRREEEKKRSFDVDGFACTSPHHSQDWLQTLAHLSLAGFTSSPRSSLMDLNFPRTTTAGLSYQPPPPLHPTWMTDAVFTSYKKVGLGGGCPYF